MLAKFDAVERKIGEMAGRMAASVAAVDAVVAESTGGCADLSTCGLRCVARGGGGSMSAVLDEVPPAPPRNGWQGQAPTAGERQQRPEKGEEEEEEEWEEEEARREKEVGTMGTLVRVGVQVIFSFGILCCRLRSQNYCTYELSPSAFGRVNTLRYRGYPTRTVGGSFGMHQGVPRKVYVLRL